MGGGGGGGGTKLFRVVATGCNTDLSLNVADEYIMQACLLNNVAEGVSKIHWLYLHSSG